MFERKEGERAREQRACRIPAT